MSTAGGAAGLTLTVATTAFLMEPSLNPGLEAQAAARIWRLGQVRSARGGASRGGADAKCHACLPFPRNACAMLAPLPQRAPPPLTLLALASTAPITPAPLRPAQTKPTRVVRLLAADSVEAAVLEVQRRKQEAGEVPADSLVGEVDPGMVLQVYDAIKDGDNPTV